MCDSRWSENWNKRVMKHRWQHGAMKWWIYQHPIYLLETFIEPARFRGTCYRAANWLCLGLTTGRGKDDLTHRPNRSLKELWVLPLGRDFRQRLCQEGHE